MIITFDGLETIVKITTIAPPIYGPIYGIMSVIPIITQIKMHNQYQLLKTKTSSQS